MHVAVVNTAHRDAALAMVAGGKAVLVEKTFAMDEAQAAEVIAAARRQVGTQLAKSAENADDTSPAVGQVCSDPRRQSIGLQPPGCMLRIGWQRWRCWQRRQLHGYTNMFPVLPAGRVLHGGHVAALLPGQRGAAGAAAGRRHRAAAVGGRTQDLPGRRGKPRIAAVPPGGCVCTTGCLGCGCCLDCAFLQGALATGGYGYVAFVTFNPDLSK